MLEEAPSPHAAPQPASERPSASLLVRCWLEPREDPGAPPILRGYVKNLKTGEETFIKDFDSVGRQIQRSLLIQAPVDTQEDANETPLSLTGRR